MQEPVTEVNDTRESYRAVSLAVVCAAGLDLRWEAPPYKVPTLCIHYEHEDGRTWVSDPATAAELDDFLAELKRLPPARRHRVLWGAD